jgi:hypothetical protein
MTTRPDGRSRSARRLRSLIRSLTADAGGDENLGFADKELVRAAALAVVRVRDLQDRIERGDDVDDATLVKLLNSAARILAPITGKRRGERGSAPDLHTYLASKRKAA